MIPISAGIPIPVADGLAEFIPDIPPSHPHVPPGRDLAGSQGMAGF